MDEQYTPGPWYVSGGDIFSNETERPTAYRRKVATVYNTPDVSTEDRQGNARLIAAAPDLFAVAEDAAAYLTETGENIGLLSDLLNAIQKATGR